MAARFTQRVYGRRPGNGAKGNGRSDEVTMTTGIKPPTAKQLRPRKNAASKGQSTKGLLTDIGDPSSRQRAKEALMVARQRRGLTGEWLRDWKTVAPF